MPILDGTGFPQFRWTCHCGRVEMVAENARTTKKDCRHCAYEKTKAAARRSYKKNKASYRAPKNYNRPKGMMMEPRAILPGFGRSKVM